MSQTILTDENYEIFQKNIKSALLQIGVNYAVSETLNTRFDNVSGLIGVVGGSIAKTYVEATREPEEIIDNLNLLYFGTAVVTTAIYAAIEYLQDDPIDSFSLLAILAASMASQKLV